mmetsp:Transcript_39524/g.126995  ORF Transcript_39524/g.126995 Transcript_39524/m.126995 type:complete len:306 (+) Transcript_39524:93-1010(+)
MLHDDGPVLGAAGPSSEPPLAKRAQGVQAAAAHVCGSALGGRTRGAGESRGDAAAAAATRPQHQWGARGKQQHGSTPARRGGGGGLHCGRDRGRHGAARGRGAARRPLGGADCAPHGSARRPLLARAQPWRRLDGEPGPVLLGCAVGGVRGGAARHAGHPRAAHLRPAGGRPRSAAHALLGLWLPRARRARNRARHPEADPAGIPGRVDAHAAPPAAARPPVGDRLRAALEPARRRARLAMGDAGADAPPLGLRRRRARRRVAPLLDEPRRRGAERTELAGRACLHRRDLSRAAHQPVQRGARRR